MNSFSNRIGATALIGAIAAATFVGAAAPASAATGATNQCVNQPAHTSIVNHDELWHIDTTTVPGQVAIVHDEQRWSRMVPAVEAVTHQEVKYTRDIPGNAEVSYKKWLYEQFIPGLKEISHKEYRFYNEVPATAEISHKEYRFSRENPGQAATSYQAQQFSRTIPGQAEKSHQEYKYQQSVTQYRFRDRVERPDNTVERKFIKGYDFVSGGTTKVGNKTVAGHWVVSAGWHSIPDSIINVVWGSGGVPPQYLGGSEANPKGNVNLSTYGGPNVNSPYYASLVTIDGGYTDYGPWSDWTTTNPGADTATRDAESQVIVTPYKGGAWTTDAPGAPWVKIDERKVVDSAAVPARTEYRKADGTPTTNVAEAAWFKETSFAGWTQFGASVTKPDKVYIAPFTEYRKADGTVTTNVAEAAWFKDSAFDGWKQFGTPKKVVEHEATDAYTQYRKADGTPTTNVAEAAWFKDSAFDGWKQFGQPKTEVTQEATPDQTFYLTKDAQGNLGQTTVKSQATFFVDSDVAVDPKWVKTDIEKVVVKEAVADKTVYLTKSEEGVLGESEDADDADWLKTDEAGVDLAIWKQMVDEHGDPLTRTVTDKDAVPAYTEYYVTGGTPTRVLGESNWTKETPEGWNFVDTRKVEDVKAVPPLVTNVKVVDKAASTETVTVPATYKACANGVLASTGGEIPWGPAGFATVAIALGLGLAIRARHRKVGPAI